MIRKIGKKDDTSVVFISKQGIGTDKTQIESRTEKCVLYLTCIGQFRAQDLLVLARETKRSTVRTRLRFLAMQAKPTQASSVRALGSCRQHSPGALGPSITAGMSKMEASLCSHGVDPHGRQAMISEFASSPSASTLSIASEQG